MNVYSNKKPFAYSYYINPCKKNRTIIKFCDNIKEENTEIFGVVSKIWVYDEYTTEVDTKLNMDEYIKDHYNELFAEAKGGPSAIQQLASKIDYLSMMSGIDI